jgi:hypothetical protein
MFVHKFNSRLAGVVLAVGAAVAVSVVVWERHTTAYPLGIKSDRLVSPQADCSEAAWPFGCDWRLYAAPARKKPSRFSPGQRRHALLMLSS